MTYTVKQLSTVSGVSVRTLHYYDEIGLLKPAYHGTNGYRYYEQEQLLVLQQILFFRELGFELKKIQKILGRPDFDKIGALYSHRKVLENEAARIRSLIETIDKTIDHLKGNKTMKDQEMYWGFSKEKQAEYEKYLVERFGHDMKMTIGESYKKTKNWSKDDWKESSKEYEELCKELVQYIGKAKPTSSRVQDLIRRHFTWIQKFWTPTKESYVGLSELYMGPEFQKYYEAFHPELSKFLSEAMREFAERELV
jgi:DNA-binding transcriptional MerR regulator